MSDERIDYPRQYLHPLIQNTNGFFGDEDLEGAALTGWALIAEFAAPDGTMNIAYVASDATGENPLPVWREDGLLHYALYSMRNEEEEE